VGHELAGIRADGTAVVVEAVLSCGECDHCRSGRYNLCPTHFTQALGATTDGGMAEQFQIQSNRLIPLPSGLDVRDGSLAEPTAVGWHALRLAHTGPDTSVAVVGAGALGLLAVASAHSQGATEVALEARHPHQIAAGERLGAKIGATGHYDVVLDAAGTLESLARAVELVGPRGRVVSVATHRGPVPIDWSTLFHLEASILPSIGYCMQDTGSGEAVAEIAEAAAMLADNPEIAQTLITHRFPLEDAVEAFRVAGDLSAYRGMSMFLVPSDTPGINIVRNVGLAGEPLGEGMHALIHYEDVRVPESALLGGEGQAFAIAQTRLGGGRIHHAMRTRLLDMTCERALSRTTAGSKLAEKQFVQGFVADSYAQLLQFRLLVMYIAWEIDKYQDYNRVRKDIATAKIVMPTILHDIAWRAMQIHGALGTTNEMPFLRSINGAAVMGLADGPTEVHKMTVAKQVLREYKPVDGMWPSEWIPAKLEAAQAKFAEFLEHEVGNQ
jgi:threonine dehydrogenase-like Zn-dependent dehydrogenase